MAKLPAPKNKFVEVTRLVLDGLIEGLGVEAVVAAASAAAPFLNTPIIRNIFRWVVEQLAEVINENLFKWGAKLIIRIQGDSRKDKFNESVLPIIQGVATDEEVQRARDAAIDVIHRGNR